MSVPTASVVMSVFNGAQFLREALDSILNQTFRDLEFIVVDDGSTDATAQILDEYQRRDPRMRVLHQENQGLIMSLNRGADLARGKYIVRMDADDVALPHRLAWQVDALEKNADLAVLGGAIEIIDANGAKIKTHRFPARHDEIRSDLLRGGFSISHPAAAIRTQALRSVGGYRKAFVGAEDYDLWLRLAERFELANLETVVLKYRQHSHQVSVQKLKQQALSHLAAQASAIARDKGMPEPAALGGAELEPAVLEALGIEKDTQQAIVVDRYLLWIRNFWDSGERETAFEIIDILLNSPEWKNAERRFVADYNLLWARIHWQQGDYAKSTAALARALRMHPRMLGRPLKHLARRVLSWRRGPRQPLY